MTKPEQCVCLITHKWADSCPHKILPVKYLSSFDKQNLSFQDLVSCKPQPLPYQRQLFQYKNPVHFYSPLSEC